MAELVEHVESLRLGELGVVRGDAIDLHWNGSPNSERTGSLSDISGYYAGLERGRLVILGEAGSGKTVTALHLVLELLDQRKRDDTDPGPVPVRVNIAGWKPESSSFAHWLSRRIAHDYALNRRMAQKLVESGRILPVLDGLDEMDEEGGSPHTARAALCQLNEIAWRGRPVVLTCRIDTYGRIRELGNDAGLHSATAITLWPLESPEIVEYLREQAHRAGIDPRRWSAVIDEVGRHGGTLQRAMGTPWLLGLTVTRLMRGDAAAAAEIAAAADEKALRECLFSDLVPAAVAGLPRRPDGTTRYTEDQVRTWLQTLAAHLAQRDTGSGAISLDRIWEVGGNIRCRALHGVTAFAVMCAWCEIITVVSGGSHYGLLYTFLFTLGYGLVCGLPATTRARRAIWRRHENNIGGRWRRALLIGLAVGSVPATFIWLATRIKQPASDVYDPATLAVVYAFMIGTPVVLAVTLTIGLTGHRKPYLDERSLIRNDAMTGLVIASIAYVPVLIAHIPSLVVALTRAGHDFHPAPFLKSAFTSALTVLVLVMLPVSKATLRYGCATVLFRAGGCFTPRPAPFLDWARHAGLLRVTGTAYEFRHDSYRRWMTSTDRDTRARFAGGPVIGRDSS